MVAEAANVKRSPNKRPTERNSEAAGVHTWAKDVTKCAKMRVDQPSAWQCASDCFKKPGRNGSKKAQSQTQLQCLR